MKTKCFLVATEVNPYGSYKSNYTDITIRVDGVYAFSDLQDKELSINLPEKVERLTESKLSQILEGLEGLDFTESQKLFLKEEIFNK